MQGDGVFSIFFFSIFLNSSELSVYKLSSRELCTKYSRVTNVLEPQIE